MRFSNNAKKMMAAAISVAALSAVAPASAEAACTPITSLPYLITQSGNYCVQSDLALVDQIPGYAAIVIDTDNVSLDLQGHEISGPYKGGVQAAVNPLASGVSVANNHSNVSVRNGSIIGFEQGVGMNSFNGPANFVVEDLTIEAVGSGILAEGNGNVTIRNNRVSMNPQLYPNYDESQSYIAVRVISNGGVIANNFIGPNSAKYPMGIDLTCDYCLVQGNYMRASTPWADQTEGYGIRVNGFNTAGDNQIVDNRVFNFRTGIKLSMGSKYGDNIVSAAETPYLAFGAAVVDIGNNR